MDGTGTVVESENADGLLWIEIGELGRFRVCVSI